MFVGWAQVPPIYPSWPSTSPWVTAVGSTRFIHNTDDQAGIGGENKQEMATDKFGSGGGFSPFIKRGAAAEYQAAAVKSFFKIVAGAFGRCFSGVVWPCCFASALLMDQKRLEFTVHCYDILQWCRLSYVHVLYVHVFMSRPRHRRE